MHDFFGDGGVHAGNLARLAFDESGEHQGAKAHLAGAGGGGVHGQAIAADHHIAHALEDWVAVLGCLRYPVALALLDTGANGGGHAIEDPVLL